MGHASNNPVPIPGRVRPNQAIRARDHNQMVDGLRALTQRGIDPIAHPNKVTPRTPFEIIPFYDSGTPKIQVFYGHIEATTLTADSAGYDLWASTYVNTTINMGDLVGDPDGPSGTEGSLTLSASTDYGVWIKVLVRKDSWGNYDAPGSDTIAATLVQMAQNHAAEIVTSSTHTNKSDQNSITASTSGYAYFYVGKVEVDADSVMTILQSRKSDLELPASLYPFAIISTDADQSLVPGTDGGIYVRTVSGDANNDISAGSDGGAFYEEP